MQTHIYPRGLKGAATSRTLRNREDSLVISLEFECYHCDPNSAATSRIPDNPAVIPIRKQLQIEANVH